ncbi:hypothetical protein SLA2020_288010 [Shorea laevis]
MSFQQDREELDGRARNGEVVVPGGTGGKSLEAQEHLAEGTMLFLLLHWIIVWRPTTRGGRYIDESKFRTSNR